MEEDIKVLESLIEELKYYSPGGVTLHYESKEREALKNVLKRLQEYKEGLDNFMQGKAFSTKQLDKVEEETLDIKRENYKLRKENFELIQDNAKLQQDMELLEYNTKNQIVKISSRYEKLKSEVKEIMENHWLLNPDEAIQRLIELLGDENV